MYKYTQQQQQEEPQQAHNNKFVMPINDIMHVYWIYEETRNVKVHASKMHML